MDLCVRFQVVTRTNPVVTIGNDQRIGSNKKDRGERCTFVNLLEIVSHVRIILGEKRQLTGPEDVLGLLLGEITTAHQTNQEIDVLLF
jgi:hypothetical protein